MRHLWAALKVTSGVSVGHCIAIALSCLYVVLRVRGLTDYGLWFDEVFSVRAAEMGWYDLVCFIAADSVHPPLFYGLLKMWIAVGGSYLLWLKVLPLLFSVLALWAFFGLCREIRMVRAYRDVALCLVAVNGLLIYYAQELRMYSLLLALSLFSLSRCLKTASTTSKRGWFLLWAVNLLLVYTHYFGWLVVFAEVCYLALACRRAVARAIVGLACLCLAYVPWLYAVGSSPARRGLAPNLGWIGRPELTDLAWFLAALHGTLPFQHSTSIGIILFWSPALIGAWRLQRGRVAMPPGFLLLSLAAVLPVTASYVGSQVLPVAIWGARQLIAAAVPYLLLLVIAVSKLPWKVARIGMVAILVLWSGAASVASLGRGEQRLRWVALTQAIVDRSDESRSSIRVYALEEWVAEPLRFSLRARALPRVTVVVLKDLEHVVEEEFWLAYRNTTWTNKRVPEVLLKERGCVVGPSTAVHDSAQRITMLWVTCRDGEA